MVQMKSSSYRFSIFMALFSLLYSVTEALPIAGNEIVPQTANWTYPPFLPDRVIFSNELEKRADVVVQATSAQIAEYKKYAGVASAAYCRAVVPLNLWTCIECLRNVPDGKLIKSFDTIATDTHGFVLRSDREQTIYLSFRGTNSVQQAIVDLIVTLANYSPVSGARVHAGFYASFKEAVPYYFSTVQSELTKYPNYKVVITGHSLGAAQALLAGLDFFQRDSRFTKNNLFIHTQGSPRVGNPTFARYVQSTGITYTRSVNERDVVPHVPSAAVGYLHAGVEVWTKSSSNVVICTSTIESGLCSDTVLITSSADHLSYYGISEGVCLL